MFRSNYIDRGAVVLLLSVLFASITLTVFGVADAQATTYTVINRNDTGAGSLRQAIANANGTSAVDTIAFDIPGDGPHSLNPATALPPITDDGLTIDGTTQGLTVCGGATNGTGGLTSRKLRIVLDGSGHAGDLLVVSGANGVTLKGMVFGEAASGGLYAVNARSLTLLCNHFGTSTDASFDVGNATFGAFLDGSADAVIGDGTLAGANVFGYNGTHGLILTNGSDDARVRGNFVGIGIGGISPVANGGIGIGLANVSGTTIGGQNGGDRNVVGSNGTFGIYETNGSGLDVSGNHVGVAGDGTTVRANGMNGVYVTGSTGTTIGRAGAGNVVTAPSGSSAIWILGTGSATIIGNHMGVAANGASSLGTPYAGLYASGSVTVTAGDGTTAGANVIRNSARGGIVVVQNARVAAIANRISGNSGPGIDLGDDDTTLNDGGDGDAGPNDLLNFPAIDAFTANGTTTVQYAVTLDVPGNANGYRLDFYRNSTFETHGEGETPIGSVTLTPGGNQQYQGSLTTDVSVSSGDHVSATLTRIAGGSVHDVTSEFAATRTATATPVPSPLIVTSTADTDTPGTLRHAINHANANAGEDAITFAIPGAGPHDIGLTSALPTITDAGVGIDGTTQSGASCGQLSTGTPHALMIRLDGTAAGATTVGLVANAAGVTVRGLSITNFDGFGVYARNDADSFLLECSYIGVTPLNVQEPNARASDTTPGVRMQNVSNGTVRNSLISGQDTDANDSGLRYSNVSGGTIEGNVIGLNAAGTAALGNARYGILIDLGSSGITVGGTTVIARNVIAGNGKDGINIADSSAITILGNYIGLGTDGFLPVGNTGDGVYCTDSADLAIGDGTAAGTNVISSNISEGIHVRTSSDLVIDRNLVGVAADGTTARGNTQVSIFMLNSTGRVSGNVAANSVLNDGVEVEGGNSRIAIYGNSIYGNDSEGIELDGGEGPNANDSDDGDSGPNDLLNHPVLDRITANGSGSVSYTVTLDVPAAAHGYRVEFFRNSAPDATNGEGETYLGAINVAGSGTHAGSLTIAIPVSSGQSLSATTTRKTASGFDITSEFSVNVTSTTTTPAQIAATKSIEVIEDGLIDGDDTVAIPGSTLRYTIIIRNDGAGAADADSTVITDQIPRNGSLKVADFAAIPGNGPLGVTQGSPSSGLTYSYLGLGSGSDDLEFSDDDGTSWTYAPMDSGDGTDPGVTHVRVRPGGIFNADGGTSPSIAMRYDVVLF